MYELSPPSVPGGTWTKTALYSFDYPNGDPQNPQGGVMIGAGGVLYRTGQFAAASAACLGYDGYGCGAVYSFDAADQRWRLLDLSNALHLPGRQRRWRCASDKPRRRPEWERSTA